MSHLYMLKPLTSNDSSENMRNYFFTMLFYEDWASLFSVKHGILLADSGNG